MSEDPTFGLKAQYERKLARQRQLELMEAAATGTAPAMELDLSSTGSVGSSSMRSRSGNLPAYTGDVRTSLRFEDSQSPSGHVRQAVSNPFASGSGEEAFSINLMDHDTGVYKEDAPPAGIFASFRNLLGASSTSSKKDDFSTETAALSSHHEFISSEPDFLGKPSSSITLTTTPVPKRRTSNPCARLGVCCAGLCVGASHQLRLCCTDPKRRRLLLCVLLGVAAVWGVLYLARGDNAATDMYKHVVTEPVLRKENTNRFNEIMDTIVQASYTDPAAFQDLFSPEYHALRWVAYSDPAKLEKTDPYLPQRYALAVMFYNSYVAFEKVAGRQQPVVMGDKQWEGVPNPGWVRKDYWMSERGYCFWYGVKCAPNAEGETSFDGNGDVVYISLSNNNVMGKIPPELNALVFLQYFDMSHNKLVGEIPWQVAKMGQINSFNVEYNEMTGTLPAEIGFWEGMKYLYLGHNGFNGALPTQINRMYNLEVLQLDHNELTGEVPSVKELKKLEQLYMDNNQFKGYFPFNLIFLTNLLELNLNDNDLSGSLPGELENLRHLRTLHLQNNRLRGPIPDFMFKRLHHLKEITLENNELTGDLPEDLGSETILQVARFNNNQLTGSIPTTWNQLHALQLLHLEHNQLTGPIPIAVGNMTALEELYLNNNQLTGQIPSQIALMQQLRTMSVEHNSLSNRVPTFFGAIGSLHSLRLHDNDLRGFMPDEVCDLFDRGMTTLTADCQAIYGRIQKCDCCTKCY